MRLKNLWKSIQSGNWHGVYFGLMPKFMTDRSLPFIGGYNLAYYLIRPHVAIMDYCRALKWFWQRGTRGYCDKDVWSLDWHLTSYMGNALRELADQVHGTPMIDTGRVIVDPNDCDTFTMEEWKATILYIAETFDIGRKIEEYDYIKVEEVDAAMKRFNHGMRMFNEYFFSLWD